MVFFHPRMATPQDMGQRQALMLSLVKQMSRERDDIMTRVSHLEDAVHGFKRYLEDHAAKLDLVINQMELFMNRQPIGYVADVQMCACVRGKRVSGAFAAPFCGSGFGLAPALA